MEEQKTAKEQELKGSLKKYAENITSSNVRQQRLVISSVLCMLRHQSAIPEQTIRGLIRLSVANCFTRFTDPQSYALVRSLVTTLSEKNAPLAIESLADCFNSLFDVAKISLTKWSIKRAAIAGKWLVYICEKVHGGFVEKQFLSTVSAFCAIAFFLTGSTKEILSFRKRFRTIYSSTLLVETISLLEKMVDTSVVEPEKILAFLCLLPVEDTKATSLFISIFTKKILLGKRRPSRHIMFACNNLFGGISGAQMKDEIFPVAKKALLRSTEVAVFGIAALVEFIKIDVSQYVNDFCAMLAAPLISPNEDVHNCVSIAIGSIAKNVSDSTAVCTLVKSLFDTYSGGNGKINSPVQRILIIETIRKLCCHCAYGKENGNIIGNEMLGRAISVISSEAHEATLCALWDAVVAFSMKMSSVARELLPVFKHSFGTAVSRSAVLRAMVPIFSNHGFSAFDDELTKAVQTVQESSNSVPGEFIASSLLLLKCENEEVRTRAWQKDVSNKIFFKEKFLIGLNEKDVVFLPELSERLLMNRLDTGPEFEDSWKVSLFCLNVTLFWPVYAIRKRAILSLNRLIAFDNLNFSNKFLENLFDYVVTGDGDKNYQRVLRHIEGTAEDEIEEIPGKMLLVVVKCVLASFQMNNVNQLGDDRNGRLTNGDQNGIVSLREESELRELQFHFLTSALLVCSLPRIIEYDGSEWIRWLQSINGYEQLFTEGKKSLKNSVSRVIGTIDHRVRENAIKLLMSAGGVAAHFREIVWNTCVDLIKQINPQIYNAITERDYAIYKTAEGKLFNTDVIEQNSDEVLDAKNVKRESKVYKYKEQLVEMQLRKELAEKRRIEGKLTKKQKEAIDVELQAEHVVREELKKLDYDCASRIGVICAAVEGNPSGSIAHIDVLYDTIIPLLRSPLVSYLAVEAYRSFRNAAFEPSEDYLHELILYTSIRLLGSFHMNKEWCEEPLTSQIVRVITMLSAQCVLGPVLSTSDECDSTEKTFLQEEMDEDLMSAAKLCFAFPLLNAILCNSSLPFALRFNTVQLLSSALDGRFIKGNELCLLPLEGLTSLLLMLTKENSVDFSHHAVEALRRLVSLINNCEKSVPSMIRVFELLLECLITCDCRIREVILVTLNAPHEFYEHVFTTLDYQLFAKNFTHRIFIACHDPEVDCSKIAHKIWEKEKLNLEINEREAILEDLISKTGFVRQSASRSLVTFIAKFPAESSSLVLKMGDLYKDLNELRGSVFDDVGRMVSDAVDQWERRSGIADGFTNIAPQLPESLTMLLMKIIVPEGLNDRNDLCRELMCDAAIEIVRKYGASKMSDLLPFLEEMLNSTSDASKDDNLRQGLVLVLGSLAQHLDPGDGKVRAIAARLIETLSTPSERVQIAVSKCLPPLVPAIKEKAKELAATLSCLLVEADSYGERRGAAYGLAGLIKGLGMSAIRELELIKMLQNSLSNKKSVKHRQGALFALERLCGTMGKLFEPYVVQVLPLLLLCFGDSDESVRKAADDAARAMMSMLSAHGVKLVLPSLLAALDEDSWRTKCASVELLGAMSHCAPKQLSACLPNIVPKLLEVLTDSHSKVQKSGEKALKQIAKVIRNPEILGISSHLLNGLVDPACKTSACLQTIVNTKFIHYIDAASLALIMPIIKRAFTDRNTDTRRMAAQIIANIYSLTDNKDMEPYLCDLVPGLQNSLLDPVPEIRTVAAKAFGAIVACSVGDTSLKLREQIVPWLKEKLVSDASPVDRSGAAQGLSEVLSALGDEQVKYAMPDIIKTTESPSVAPEVRDGYILLYIYLPMVFGDKFVPYLPQVIPSILRALADENEYVRDSALRAGQRLIAMFCSHARRLLLPQLQAALFDDNWRIRYASVTLIGDFLFNISGVSGKMTSATASEDDTMGMEAAGRAIIRQLGQACRDRVLAGIYLARSDVALTVRQAAGHVWKIVVANTPRTLKEIMRTLFEMLLGCLASSSEDRQQMAARCLGELVKKMGERILIDVLPVLEMGLQSESVDQRQGVAIALHEIIVNTTKDVVAMYSTQLVEPIKKALQDPEPEVRKAAASTFTVYQQSVGLSAFDEIITSLIDMVSTSNEDIIIDGLSEVMRQNSRQMLPYVLPKLTRPPVNTKALCALSSVAGDSLTSNLGRILEFLLDNCNCDEEIEQALNVVSSVTDPGGVMTIISTLLQRALIQNQSVAATLLHLFAQNTKVELKTYTDEILPRTLLLYNSSVPTIVDSAIGTLMCLSQNMDQRSQLASLGTLKQALISLKTEAERKDIPGLAHPKGLQPLLPMLRESILSGGVETKEMAGETLGILVAMSDLTSLKAHVVSVTGPLIRVLGDRYPPSVKIAILTTLIHLLDKVDTLLRPFLPQLQSTFLKALQEPSSKNVRLYSGGALSRLIKIHPKPEPIILELIKLLNNAEDFSLIETTLVCLRAVLNRIHEKLTVETSQAILKVAERHCGENAEDATLQAASALYGEGLIRLNSFTNEFLKVLESGTNVRLRHSYAIALQHALSIDAEKIVGHYSLDSLRTALISLIQSDKSFIACAGVRAVSFVLLSQKELDLPLFISLARAVNHHSNDVKRVAGVGMQFVTQRDLTLAELKAVVPMLVNGTKEKNTPVRIAFEQALISAFKLRRDESLYETYLSSIEGAAHDVLAETYRSLSRSLKKADSGLEPLSDLIAVP